MSHNKQTEAAADIQLDLQEGPGFMQVAPPKMSANEVARAMTGKPSEIVGPVAIPEEHASTPMRSVPSQHPMRGSGIRKPIAEIVDQFLADIQNHPDAHLLTTTLAGPADESEAQTFPNVPVRTLRVDSIRLIRRTTSDVMPETEKKQTWQDAVIAGHVDAIRAQQAVQQNNWRRPKATVDPEMIAAITVAVAEAMKAQPVAASA